jgi:hypothetical protein
VKLLLNSVISTPGAKCMMADLKDFYLGTPMEPEDYAYARFPVNVIPEAIMQEYNLEPLIHNGFVYVVVRKGCYGLAQAGRIANDRLKAFLEPYGYEPVSITGGLWRHKTRDIRFALIVDDSAVKYLKRQDAEHLMATLKLLYNVSEDWTGGRYAGLTIGWDYDAGTVDISMPGYAERALQRFKHPNPTRKHDSPAPYQTPTYGAKIQYAPEPDSTPVLDLAETKHIQEVVGSFLYYAQAVDNTMLVPLGDIAAQQNKPTKATMQTVVDFLNYCATHPNAIIRYYASDMCLWIDGDASYLCAPEARSRWAGWHYLSDMPEDPDEPPKPGAPLPMENGPVHVPCKFLRVVVSSAAEAETAATFNNGKEGCALRITLDELGHPQPPTPLSTDNTTAMGIANDTVKQKRSKAIDMRFYWIRDRVRQKQFHVYWRAGRLSHADYHTKKHPTKHHRRVRPAYLYCPNDTREPYFTEVQREMNQRD